MFYIKLNIKLLLDIQSGREADRQIIFFCNNKGIFELEKKNIAR